MKKLLLSACSFLLLNVTTHLHAQQGQDGLALGLKAGTTGIAIELVSPVTETVNVRLGYNWLEYDRSFNTDDVRYSGDLIKKSAAVFADWHPGAGSFRISAGAYRHFDNYIDVTGRPTASGTYEFNNQIYSADNIGSVRGRGRFNRTVPYLGIGWGNASRAENRIGFSTDLGVLYQDSARVDLQAFNCTLPAGLCTQLNADLNAEAEELEEEMSDYKWWPVLKLGVYFQF